MIAGSAAKAGVARIDLAGTSDFDIGPVRVRPMRRQLALGPDDVRELEPRVMQVLVALAQAGGEVVSRDQLNDLCWEGRIVSDDSINRCILSLRRLARSVDPVPFTIETVARVGYALTGPKPIIEAVRVAPVSPAPAPDVPRSVAVLPFTNLTGDSAKEYLADGMAEELITTLSRVSGLKVPARTSSFAYRGRDADVREIGRQLGVAAIVEGSLRVAGQRIRLTVQLIDAATGFHLWANNFDRDMGDLLDLQDELARSVAAALGRELARSPRPTGNPEAMRLHLQARSVAGRITGDALARAEALLRRAIELDPAFASAHEGLAATLLVAIGSGAKPFAAREDARREAEHALALDPALSGARSIIASLDALQGEWSDAERSFTAALKCDEADPISHEAFTQFVLMPTGMLRRAWAHAERAHELAPARAMGSYTCAVCQAMLGESAAASGYVEMAALLGISERLAPFRVLRAYCLFAEWRLDEAVAEIAAALPEIAREAGGEEVVRTVYRTVAGAGDPGAASAQVSALFDACRGTEDFWRDVSLPGLLLGWQTVLGALDEAYRIAGAVTERKRLTRHLATPILCTMWFPSLARFRADPRFQTFVGELGMLDYWASAGPPDGYALRDGRLVPA